MQDFIKLINESQYGLTLCRLPILGSALVAYDSYNRTTVHHLTPFYAEDRNAYSMRFTGAASGTNGGFYVVDSGAAPELQSLDNTVFMFFDAFNPVALQQRIVGKRDAGGTYYEIRCDGANNVTIAGTVSASVLTTTAFDGAKSITASFSLGSAAAFYANGNYLSHGAGTFRSTVQDADLYVGELYNAASPLLCGIQGVLIFNKILSPADISLINSEFYANIRGLRKGKWFVRKKLLGLPPDDLESACVDSLTGEIVRGNVIGRKTGTYYPTVRVQKKDSIYYVNNAVAGRDTGDAFQSATVTLSANAAALTPQVAGAIELLFTPHGYVLNTYLLDGNCNLRTRLVVISNQLYAYKGNTPIWTGVTGANSLVYGKPHHAILQWWTDAGTKYAELYLNGVLADSGVFGDSTVATNLALLSSNIGTAGATSDITLARFYNRKLTLPEIRRLYSEVANTPRVMMDRFAYPVSIAGVGAGSIGPWRISSGTWVVEDDGSRRSIRNGSYGLAYLENQQHYNGAWYIKLKHSTSNNNIFKFYTNANFMAAGEAGFGLYTSATGSFGLFRGSNGGVSAWVSGATTANGYLVDGVEYEFFITRNHVDLWTVYIRGGAYTTWRIPLNSGASPITGTDPNYKSARYALALWGVPTLYDFRVYPMGHSLTPNDLPDLMDK